jgi:hypothetical protein
MSKQPPKKKQRNEANKAQLLQLVSLVQRADKLGMFRCPVNPSDVPGYLEVIRHPMDLGTITRKINEGKYATNDDAVSDFRLMLSNALEFNEKGDTWYENARTVRKRLPELLKQSHVETNDNSDDSDDDFIPQGREDDNEKSLAKEEKRRREDIHATLQKMDEELNIPIEVLRQRYQQAAIPIAGDGEAFQEDDTSSNDEPSTSSSDGEGDDDDGSSSDFEEEGEDDSSEGSGSS